MRDEWYVVVRDRDERAGGKATWLLKHTSTTEEYGRFAAYADAEREAEARNRRDDRPPQDRPPTEGNASHE
jgi:hypothetical protein